MQGTIMTKHRLTPLAAGILLGIGHSSTGSAAGFALIEHSVNGVGNAFAGAAAVAEDPSTIYFNPAGMRHLKGVQYDAGLSIISPTAKFKDRGSTTNPVFGGAPLDVNNEDGGDAGPTAFVPIFYYARDLENGWSAGLGINAPFGLATEYNTGWVGRYHALTSDLKTININPSLAYSVNKDLAVGFGLNVQYIDARLSQAIDYGSLFSISPQGLDGKADVRGDDISFGYNFGALWNVNDSTRIGAAYRSRITHKLEGDVRYDAPSPAIAATAQAALNHVSGSDVEADVTLPDSLSLSFHHQLSPKLALLGDVTWTNWSTLDELRVEFESGANDAVNTLEWDDAYRYSLGLTYQYSDKWIWRAGVAYDETPIPNAQRRTPRIPDANRTWIAAGFNYKVSKNFKVDMGYAHLFFDDSKINQLDMSSPLSPDENFARGNLIGEYEVEADILSLQAQWAF
jgi:long-chain fatty acid transport protein